VTKPQIFALDIDGKPTLVFDATGIEEARVICQDDTLRADLCTMTAQGAPICAVNSLLQARLASSAEVSAFEYAVKRAPPSDEPTMAFLVKIDGTVVIAIDHS
jgi:hypothetical protein